MLVIPLPAQAQLQGNRFASLDLQQAASPYVSVRADAAEIPMLERRIAVDLEKTPLEHALAQIAARAGLRLTYSTDLLPGGKRVSLHAARIPAKEAVLQVLSNTSLDLLVAPSGDAVVVTRAEADLPVVRQATTLSGLVTDAATAQPLSGAAIAVIDLGISAITGMDGRYTIANATPGTHQVRASMIGYAAQTQSITLAAEQSATANFALEAQAISLEGVVAVGYGTQKVKDITGAVASVKADEIKQIPTPSVGEALKGRVAGVDILTGGYKPGDNPTIRIRGARSLNANNDPLIVVDGVAIAGGLGDINPSSIQSIDVLKDASATAVYGSRGANGVVLITTNRGRAGDTKVTYGVSYGAESIHNMVELFDGPEYAQYKRDARRATGTYPCPGREVCDAGDQVTFYPEELAGLANGVSTDWMDLIARTGYQQTHQLTVSGGNESTQFSIGANYYDEDGVTVGMDYARRGATFNLNHTHGRFRAGISANLNDSRQNLGAGDGIWGIAMQINPLGSPRDADGELVATPIPDGQQWNPLLEIQNRRNERIRTRGFGNIFAAYELFPGVSLQTTFGTDAQFGRTGTFAGAMTKGNRGSGNETAVERSQTLNYVSTTQLQLDRQITDSQRASATFLFEAQNQTYEGSSADVQDLPYEYQTWNNLGTAGLVSGLDSDFSDWLLESFMGRINYTLLDRYYLTVTGREDCSSRLAPGNKCGFFPSAAVKWRISDEGFMQEHPFVSDMSLRASYGRTGNTAISPYQTMGALSRTTYNFSGKGAYGFEPDQLANPDLGWEKTNQFDLGFEFGFIDQRIAGSIDYYRQNTSDLLLERQLPMSSGFSSVLQNVGRTRNTGVELSLTTVNMEDFHGLNWSTNVNWATNRNEIVSLYGGTEDDIGSRWFIGEPISVFYDREFDGIWQNGQEQEAASYSRKVGQIRVIDQNGDGVIDDLDRVIIGRPGTFPKWTGSMANRFQWGNVDLSGLIFARWGYTIDSSLDASQNTLSGRYNNLKVDYWTPENPSNTNPQPLVNQERPIDIEARRYKNGSHWRVRNITLGYRVPASLVSRIGGESLRVYAQAQDPFLFTDYEGFDPEGGGNAAVPSYRTLLLGATVGF
jgi:TonB-linked SusC/RagA family outer membrane protein